MKSTLIASKEDPATQRPASELLVRTGGMAAVTWWGPFREHPAACGPRLRELGVTGTAVMEGTPDPAGSHLAALGLKVAPFLEGGLVCLAAPVQDYARQRLHATERLPVLRDAVALFDAALPEPVARIESSRNERVEITTFGKGDELVLAVHRNDVRIMFDPRGDLQPAIPVELTLGLAAPAGVHDPLSGREWPVCDRVTFTLDPVWPTFLRLTPRR